MVPLLLALSTAPLDAGETFEPKLALSASVTTLATTAEIEQGHLGAGGSVTVLLVPRWLEVEAVSHLLTSAGGSRVATDLVLRLPFEWKPWLMPYVGVGGTWLSLRTEQDTGNYFGFASVVGLDTWADRRLGFFMEANYNLVRHHHLVHEVGMAMGVTVAVL